VRAAARSGKRSDRTVASSTISAVSGLETLPPDQRAVLQLILVQGRGYADLAALLKLDVEAVRSRAHAGLDALSGQAGTAPALDAAQRARVADYLLGQQDDGERIVTFAELAESDAACRWAQGLRERLAGVAQGELPEVPAAASSNGHAPATAPAPALAPAAAPATATQSAVASAPAAAVPAPPAPPPSPPDRPAATTVPGAPRSSRLGGAVLLAGIAALAVVLAIVLIGGGDDDPDSSAATSPTQAQTQPQRTQPSTTPTAQPRLIAQVNLNATAVGGEAIGIGLVQRSGGRAAIAIEAQRLPANGAQDIYAVWLQGAAGSRFLGFVPRQVRAGGRFTVSAALPGNARDFSTVLITREGISAVPQTPGEAILTGALRLAR
jgi:Sigma-70, region 4